MATISLEGLKFKAPIGVYAEEKILMNNIEVDFYIEVSSVLDIQRLSDTLNYEQVYKIIKKEISKEADLLEDALSRILQKVASYCKTNSPNQLQICRLKAKIKKLTPPIKGHINSVSIQDELIITNINTRDNSKISKFKVSKTNLNNEVLVWFF